MCNSFGTVEKLRIFSCSLGNSHMVQRHSCCSLRIPEDSVPNWQRWGGGHQTFSKPNNLTKCSLTVTLQLLSNANAVKNALYIKTNTSLFTANNGNVLFQQCQQWQQNLACFCFYVSKLNTCTSVSSLADTKDNKKLPQRGIHGKDGAFGELFK